MVAFLTDAWMAELDRAARAARLPGDLHLVIQQIVRGADGTELAYAIRVADGRASVTAGRASEAEVTFTQDRATAEEIAKGTLSAQVAFMSGRLRVGGDLRDVLERSGALVEIDDIFASARSATSW